MQTCSIGTEANGDIHERAIIFEEWIYSLDM
jgi:hypothetical protein